MNSDSKKLSFEDALAELEKIIASMEQGEVSLSESVKYYERAMALHQQCQNELQQAKLKIEQLLLAQNKDEPSSSGKKIVGKKEFTIDDKDNDS